MPFASLHYDAQLLIEKFRQLKVGEVVTFEEMEQLIDKPVKAGTKGYSRLTTARRVCLRDHQILIDAVPKVGVKRLTGTETIGSSQRSIRKANKEAKRGIQKIITADYDKLSNEDKIRHNTVASHLGVLAEITSSKSQQKLQGVVASAHNKLPLSQTLAAFGITGPTENGKEKEGDKKKEK